MSTYISGGCKNGKSFYAQRVAKAGGTPLYYIATMIPHDSEDHGQDDHEGIHRRKGLEQQAHAYREGVVVQLLLRDEPADAQGVGSAELDGVGLVGKLYQYVAKISRGHVFITGMNADINKIFAMTGFTNLFEFR